MGDTMAERPDSLTKHLPSGWFRCRDGHERLVKTRLDTGMCENVGCRMMARRMSDEWVENNKKAQATPAAWRGGAFTTDGRQE